MWKKLETEKDIHDFLLKSNELSDCCLKELKYISGSFIDDDNNMHATNCQRSVCLVFNSSNLNTGTIELKFEGLAKLILEPYNANYDSIIYEITFCKYNHLFYWFDYATNDLENFEPKGTCIIAERAYYRFEN